jgi:hypothetical protein
MILMDISYYANLSEIIGTAVVVVSLIYVAIQIRQNNQYSAMEAQRARTQSVQENFKGFADNAEICVKDLNGETLTDVETYRMNALWMRSLFSYQTSFLQLPRNEIIGHANMFHRLFETMSSIRTTWENNHDTFHPDFVQFIDEYVINKR